MKKKLKLEQITDQQILFAIGVNHNTAPVEVREKIYIHEPEIPELIAKFKETLSECIVLSTCNRTEIYGVHNSADVDFDFYKNLLIDFKNSAAVVKKEHFFSLVSCAVCQHLFRVSTSVDSKIIGDTQILQQLRHAYVLAQTNHSAGKILNQLAQRAFKIGKKTRAETSIHKGAISISLAAVELASDAFGALKDKTVLIIGAGDTARLTAESLLKKNVGKILITNRTAARAEELLLNLRKSHNFKGETIEFGSFKSVLNRADIAISSTGSTECVLTLNDFQNQTNKILLIDIAVPRDIDASVSRNENVVLKNIDDLHSIVDKNFELRAKDLPLVKKIIMNELGDFLMWYYALPLLPDFRGRTGKLDAAQITEIKEIKNFLARNVSEIHKSVRQTGGDSTLDLKNHLDLVGKLYRAKNNLAEVSEH